MNAAGLETNSRAAPRRSLMARMNEWIFRRGRCQRRAPRGHKIRRVKNAIAVSPSHPLSRPLEGRAACRALIATPEGCARARDRAVRCNAKSLHRAALVACVQVGDAPAGFLSCETHADSSRGRLQPRLDDTDRASRFTVVDACLIVEQRLDLVCCEIDAGAGGAAFVPDGIKHEVRAHCT